MDKNSEEILRFVECRRSYIGCRKEDENLILENAMLAIQDFLMSIGYSLIEIRGGLKNP